MRTLFILLLLTAPLFAEDITIQVEHIDERYNIRSGDFIYHITDDTDLLRFANTIDEDDDDRTATVRQIVKQALDANGGNIQSMTDSFAKQKTYSVVKESVSYIDVTPTPIEEVI